MKTQIKHFAFTSLFRWPFVVGIGFLPLLFDSSPEILLSVIIFFSILLFVIYQRVLKRLINFPQRERIEVEITLLTMVLISFVSATGGGESYFFFLYYFLLFFLSLFLNYRVSIVVTISVFIFSIPSLISTEISAVFGLFLQYSSLVLSIPLSIFISNMYLSLLESQQQIRMLLKQKTHNEDNLNEIENDSLMWTIFQMKGSLSNIKSYLFTVINDDSSSSLSYDQQLYLIRAFKANEEVIDQLKELQKNI